jgi:hypothetical protein
VVGAVLLLFGEHDCSEVDLGAVVTCGVERFSEGLDAVAGIAELAGICVDELAEKGGVRGEQPRGPPAIPPCRGRLTDGIDQPLSHCPTRLSPRAEAGRLAFEQQVTDLAHQRVQRQRGRRAGHGGFRGLHQAVSVQAGQGPPPTPGR